MMVSLDKLKVSDKALANAASLAQYSRSSEGARLRSAAKRQHLLDYAIGSALECAACLDARTDKLDPEEKDWAMALLDRIASRLRGLGSG